MIVQDEQEINSKLPINRHPHVNLKLSLKFQIEYFESSGFPRLRHAAFTRDLNLLTRNLNLNTSTKVSPLFILLLLFFTMLQSVRQHLKYARSRLAVESNDKLTYQPVSCCVALFSYGA